MLPGFWLVVRVCACVWFVGEWHTKDLRNPLFFAPSCKPSKKSSKDVFDDICHITCTTVTVTIFHQNVIM